MSDYGLFEADEVAANEPRRQARTAARHLDAAIHEVRRGFGRFLMGATGIDEFEDRWHLSKADIRSTVEPHVFPNTGTMRRIQNAMKADWKLAHPYKLAEDRDAPIVDIDETFSPDSGNLIPEGNFSGYQDSVDQNGPEKVQNAFTPGTDREAAKLVADIYTDFARSNGMRVASLETLDRYASTGIHDADYSLLQSLIVAACECDDDEEGGEEKEAPKASESDSDDDSDDDSEAPDFGGESESEGQDEGSEDDESDDSDSPESESGGGGEEEYDFGGGDDPEGGDGFGDDTGDDDPGMGDAGGGQQFTVPEQAPELEPQLLNEIPHDDPQGAAPVPPEVIDSLLGLPEGTIEQLLLQEVEQGQGGGDGFGGPPQGGPPPAGPEQGGAPQGGGEDFFGGGGGDAEQEPPRVARRRTSNNGIGRGHPDLVDDWGPSRAKPKPKQGPKTSDEAELDDWSRASEKADLARMHAARRFWAAEEEPSGGDSGGGEAAAPPAQDPAAAGGAPPMDPAAMAQPQLPPPGSQAVAPPAPAQPLENQPAEDALLDTANQAIMQMIDRETQEYQQIIDPLSQALQAVQFAQQVEQSEHPMDVTPPQGSVNVDPSQAPGGAQNPMQPTARRRQAGPYDEGVDALSREMGRKLIDEPAGRNFPTSGDVPWPEDLSRHLHGDPSRSGYDAGFDASWHPSFSGHEDPWQAAGNAWTNAGGPGSGFDDGWQDSAADIPHRHNNPEGYQEYRSHQARLRKAKVRTALRGAARVIAARYKMTSGGERLLLEAMGRRQYEHAAEALRLMPTARQVAPEEHANAVKHVAEMFAADNARFNKDAFIRSILASNPRDRAGDAWRDGRDRGVAEHGRHDMADAQAEDEQNHWEQDPEYRKLYQGSRGRLPFDRPRLAGETWQNTPTMDAFEFVGQGEVPRISDNNTSNELPKLDGAEPHRKGGSRAREAKDIRKKLENWMAQQQAKGLNYGGDVAAEGFLNTRKKPLGPQATQMVHQQVGAPAHPEAEPAAPRVKAAPKAVNPVTKKGSFFTRKVSGWKWDDHLSGYLSKEARAFTCACGEKVAAPSYKTCKCGKIWNVYAIGDSHHLASDTADVYIAREIPVRDNVIMASRKMAGGYGFEADDDADLERRLYHHQRKSNPKFREQFPSFEDYQSYEPPHDEGYDPHGGEMPGYRPPGGTVAKKSQRELLAEIDKLADWTIYDDEDPSRQGGPKKPPSTKVPTGDTKWHSRNSDGKYLSPATFAPKKK